MQKQICYFNTPSTQCTARSPEKDYTTYSFQKNNDYNYNKFSDSKGQIQQIIPHVQKQQTDYLIPYQNITPQDQNHYYTNDSLSNIHDNIKLITQQFEEKSNELKIEQQKRLDIEIKFAQLQQNNQLLEEELSKQKQLCKQMENFNKELDNKFQIQFNTTQSNSSQQDENIFNIIKQKEQEIQELKQLLANEKDQESIKQDRLMKEFQIIFQKQKTLNQQMLLENIQLQKALNNQTISSKSQSKLLDEQQLRQILQNYYTINNEECLQQIPVDQYLSAIKILKEITLSENSNQKQQIHPQKQNKIINQSHLQELKDKQEQLIEEIKKQMEIFIQQKNTQQKDIIQFKNETDELQRQLDQVENLIQEMEQNPKQQLLRNSNVSFENYNFE
ncbi:unnamed protein product [Paramecium pentaurelia]|uniref:Uncharacterized protein n=1 Tax=Paramecium pentaurelia TaxID=43138 RepID=A0A8S1Y7Y2_9CILI|nr:unnamed protein product [Paramecium pentaurelia]